MSRTWKPGEPVETGQANPGALASKRSARLLAGSLLVALAAGTAPTSTEGRAPAEDMDPGLRQAIQAIRRGFSMETTEPILPLVPEASKIYLAVNVIAQEPSYYSRDQLGALLRKAFETYRTVQFMIRFDREDGAEKGSEMILCRATWIYESHGSSTKLNLRFILSRRPAIWTLKEIRETL